MAFIFILFHASIPRSWASDKNSPEVDIEQFIIEGVAPDNVTMMYMKNDKEVFPSDIKNKEALLDEKVHQVTRDILVVPVDIEWDDLSNEFNQQNLEHVFSHSDKSMEAFYSDMFYTSVAVVNFRVIETIKLPFDRYCQPMSKLRSMAGKVDEIIEGLEISLKNFQGIVYVLREDYCSTPALAMAQLGPSCGVDGICRVWTFSDKERFPSVIAHELGHTFGLQHSGASHEGTFYEYNDHSCMMGHSNGRLRRYNGLQSYLLGVYSHGDNAQRVHHITWNSQCSSDIEEHIILRPAGVKDMSAGEKNLVVISDDQGRVLRTISFRRSDNLFENFSDSAVSSLQVHRYAVPETHTDYGQVEKIADIRSQQGGYEDAELPLTLSIHNQEQRSEIILALQQENTETIKRCYQDTGSIPASMEFMKQ